MFKAKVATDAKVDNFIHRAFRDVADQDYILARMAFREHLDIQFIWLSHQALEKYLKAVLLYNRRPAKKLGHSLRSAYDAVLSIQDLPFSFPSSIPEFISYLDETASRYFEFPYEVGLQQFLQLDEAVWHIRRWCAPIRGRLEISTGQTSEIISMLPLEIAKRQHQYYFRHRQKFTLFDGYLEAVTQKRRNAHLREHLLWNNLYFSHRRKPSFAAYRWASDQPPTVHAELLAELEPLVHFSKEFRKRIAELTKKSSASGCLTLRTSCQAAGPLARRPEPPRAAPNCTASWRVHIAPSEASVSRHVGRLAAQRER